MISHNTIASNPYSRKSIKRLGRGDASGHGSFSGRGCKGQNSRAGGSKFSQAFEGGQTPLFRRMPKKKGFKSAAHIEFTAVNVSTLAKLAEAGYSEITKEILSEKGFIRNVNTFIKILGDGEITTKVSVKAERVSASAKEKIEKAGGSIEILA